MNSIISAIFGLSFLSCVIDKEVETGLIVEDSAEEEENPIWWDEEDCSYNEGDHICNLRLPTALDTADEVYNYFGRIFLLEITSMRCSDCQRSSGQNSYMQARVGDIKWITIIIENEAGITPSSSDGRRWGNAFGLQYFNIWLGSRSNIDINQGKRGFAVSEYPSYVLVDDELRIRVVIEGYDKDKIIDSVIDLKSDL